jgi:hypothetical protein
VKRVDLIRHLQAHGCRLLRFHARYQDQEVLVEIQSGLVKGAMSKRPLRLVLE